MLLYMQVLQVLMVQELRYLPNKMIQTLWWLFFIKMRLSYDLFAGADASNRAWDWSHCSCSRSAFWIRKPNWGVRDLLLCVSSMAWFYEHFLLKFLKSILCTIQESKNGEGSCNAKRRKRVAQECQDKVSYPDTTKILHKPVQVHNLTSCLL